MTLEEKSWIAEMRRAGIGYKKIAQDLGTSENTIKTFCHRNGLTGAEMEAVRQNGASVPGSEGEKVLYGRLQEQVVEPSHGRGEAEVHERTYLSGLR